MANPLATMPAERRRTLTWALMAVGLVTIVVAVTVWLTVTKYATTAFLVALVVLLLVLLAELALLVVGEAIPFDEQGDWHRYTEEATRPAGEELLLRCTGCGDVFTVIDTGARPLRTPCPHCGKIGVLKAPAGGAAPQ